MTKLIIGDRQSGRTTDLIKAAAEDEARGVVCYIVCHSQEEAYRIAQEARKMRLNIGFPLTYDEFIHRSYSGTNIDKFYIDNLRMFLAHICPISIETVVW
jgi:F0F1-type ATP synthase alpha subunit